MPYASKAQQRLFHAKEARGEISKKTVDEFDKATNFSKLPEKKATPLHEAGRPRRGKKRAKP